MSSPAGSAAETTHRGVPWRRDGDGRISFYDTDGRRWVDWAPGVDAPPFPPDWTSPRPGGRAVRPGWRTRWRLIPLGLVALAVSIGVAQAVRPSGQAVTKEAIASAGLFGKCLAQHGTAEGHPKYSATPVPCGSSQASVKVVKVLPSTPGSPICPSGSTGVELPYGGVRYPHIECVEAAHSAG